MCGRSSVADVSTDQPPGARYVVRVTAADVGARVVLRRRLPEGALSDLLGKLVEWADVVVVRDREGVEHTLARTEVVAAKRVPPPPERRR